MELRRSLHLGVVAIEKGAFGSPTLLLFTYIRILKYKAAHSAGTVDLCGGVKLASSAETVEYANCISAVR